VVPAKECNLLLVTGAGGLIGEAVCRASVSAGWDVVAVWRSRRPAPVRGLRDRRRDLATESVGPLDGVAALVHAAAQLPGLDDPARVAEHNRIVDDSVLSQALRAGCRVVYLSGTSVYGRTTGEEPVTEDASLRPADPYAAAKADAEDSGRALAARYGTPFTTLRVSAPYGPCQRAATVLQKFVTRALSGEPLGYHGSGTREQTFTFVDDVADAVLRAVEGPPGAYNVAGSAPVTMRRLADMVVEAAGAPADLVLGSGQEDPQEGFLARYDTSRAHGVLGWSPRVDLAGGLARVVDAQRASREREGPCSSG